MFDDAKSQRTIAGTPLYQSPQVLLHQWYDEKVDTWALGCILFKLLTGKVPFPGSTVTETLQSVKQGRYEVPLQSEPICFETCLFLLDCLQLHEHERMDVNGLLAAPFVSEEYASYPLHAIDDQSLDCLKSLDQGVVALRASERNDASEKITETFGALSLTIRPSQMKQTLAQ